MSCWVVKELGGRGVVEELGARGGGPSGGLIAIFGTPGGGGGGFSFGIHFATEPFGGGIHFALVPVFVIGGTHVGSGYGGGGTQCGEPATPP